MRNLRLLVLVVPAFLLPIACEDSGSSSGGVFAQEAGPGFDSSTPEAGPEPDAGADVVVPPAPKGVTVTVTSGGLPKLATRVLAHDATGAVTGDVKTNAAGKVSFATAPSMVTVLNSTGTGLGSSVSPITYLGVADGDNLVVVIPPANVVNDVPYAKFNVSFTSAAPIVNSNSISVYAQGGPDTYCYGFSGAPGTPASVDLYPNCLATQNAVIALAADNSGLLGFGYQKNVAKPAMSAMANVGPLTFAAPGKATVTASNLPAGNGILHYARFGSIANGALFDLGYQSGTIDTGDLSYSTATGFAEAYQTSVFAESHGLGNTSQKAFIRREATTAPALTAIANFDFVNALPFISNVGVARPMPARPDVTITSDAALTGADAGVVALTWYVNITESSGTWLFVVPPSTTGFKVPALPADATEFVPADTVSVGATIFFDATQLTGYKDVKVLPISTNNGVDFVDFNRPLPAAGTVRVSSYRTGQRG